MDSSFLHIRAEQEKRKVWLRTLKEIKNMCAQTFHLVPPSEGKDRRFILLIVSHLLPDGNKERYDGSLKRRSIGDRIHAGNLLKEKDKKKKNEN